MKKYIIRETVTGRMDYYYSIEAISKEKAMETYQNTYPSNEGSEFTPDDNGSNNTEIVEEVDLPEKKTFEEYMEQRLARKLWD